MSAFAATLATPMASSSPKSSSPRCEASPTPTPTPTSTPTTSSPSSTTLPATTTTPKTAATGRRMTIFYSPDFKKHGPPANRRHPECPARLTACVRALHDSAELAPLLDWTAPQSVAEGGDGDDARRERVLEAVRAVHTFPGYLQEVEDTARRGGGALDADTYVGPDSFDVALLAAGAWMEGVDAVMGGEKVAWALARPPGHHAVPACGMGFCLLSNAAIAAKYALTLEDVNSVAILDYDVHHGNGTEAFVKNEEHIRFASSHQWPLYPGSGPAGVSGRFDNVLNVNLESGTGLEEYRAKFEEEMLPFLLQSEAGMPDLVIVSAGFDALDVDPLAGLEFKPSDYRLFTELLLKAIGKDTKVVFGLEGGYNLEDNGVGAAVRESIAGFCIQDPSEEPELEEGA